MLTDRGISIHLSCQQFECNSFEINPESTVLRFESTRKNSDEVCPHCEGRVHVCDNGRIVLKDMLLWHGLPLALDVGHHRYRCTVLWHTPDITSAPASLKGSTTRSK